MQMNRQVTSEEFYKVIGPLNVTLEVKGNYPFKTLFLLKDGRKLVGFEEHERYYLCEEAVTRGSGQENHCHQSSEQIEHAPASATKAMIHSTAAAPAES